MPRNHRPCSICGTPRPVGKGSRETVTCQPCRRALTARQKYELGITKTPPPAPRKARPSHTCEGCGESFSRHAGGKDDLRFCSRGCATRSRHPRKWDWVCYLVHSNCGHCGSLIVGRRARAHCNSTCAYRAAKSEPVTRPCLDCSTHVTSPRLRCTTCARARKVELKRTSRRVGGNNMNTRARRICRTTGAEYQWINRHKVMVRDGWTCGICGDRIDPDCTDLMRPSLDHVVALAAGGSHTYGNVQASHFLCNSYKGAGHLDLKVA
jgi:hypothetical protein